MCTKLLKDINDDRQPLPEGKYRIAMILPHFHPYVGGGEKLFYEIAKGLVKEGHDVHVVAEKVDEEHSGYKEIEGIKIWYCPWKSAFGHPFPKRRDIEPHIAWCDIAHTSTYTTTPIVSKLARKYKKPSVITIHEVRGPMWFKADTFIRALIFWMVEQVTVKKKFSVYHAVSDASKRDTERYTKRKNVVRVYNCNEFDASEADPDFDVREYFGIKKDSNIFLYYGRPGKTKGIDVYRDALISLMKENSLPENIKFCFILGKEPADLRKIFEEQIQKAGLSDRVLIRPSLDRSKLAAAIMQANTVVVPSLTEGFGFSALEACLLGRPLVHSDGGALPEVVYGQCLSFTNGDAMDLKNKLLEVIQKGESAFTRIPEKRFTSEETIKGIIGIYDQLMK